MAPVAREQGLDPRTVKRFANAEHPDYLPAAPSGARACSMTTSSYLLEPIAEGFTKVTRPILLGSLDLRRAPPGAPR
jgi:hypothetical protein